MTKKPLPIVSVKLDKIVGGGQALATLESGQKLFVWGGLPDETVKVRITKKRSKLAEGVVVEVIEPSPWRILPRDPESYLSTSPWQIMTFDAEQHYKSALIEEAFELHDIVLPNRIEVYSDSKQYEYRNKVEFSWWWDKETEQLDLAFFRRGSHGKIPIGGTSLARPKINQAAIKLRDLLRTFFEQRSNFCTNMLKTVLIRCNADGGVAMQLYVKDPDFEPFSIDEIKSLDVDGFELIFSNPQSPASVITKRLQSWGKTNIRDVVLNVPLTYAVESFFQINIPVYEKTLSDMKQWVSADKPVVDLYSGVGTIGLTIGGKKVAMIEINENAVNEMKQNISSLKLGETVRAILAPSENSLDFITDDSIVIVDPPRAGLHKSVIQRLIEVLPERIIYLSCNPVTQARDVSLLTEKYGISHHHGYNFFPRTPHVEHLAVLDLKKSSSPKT